MTRTRLRIGDGAQMATIGFVDELTAVAKPVAKPVVKKTAAKEKVAA